MQKMRPTWPTRYNHYRVHVHVSEVYVLSAANVPQEGNPELQVTPTERSRKSGQDSLLVTVSLR
jgi:hypothetical protein